MNLSEVVEKARREAGLLTKLPTSSVVGAKKDGDSWSVTIELVEKKSIPDSMDVLGIYEVKLDEKGEVTGLERKGLRKRGDTEERRGRGL